MDEKFFRIRKDKDRAKNLLDMAKDRMGLINIIPREKAYKLIEEYYEIIKELLTAVTYIDGHKILGHVELIEYFSSNYASLNEMEIGFIDRLRKFRIGIVYYGRRISQDFLVNNEDEIKRIIRKLFGLVEKKLKE